MNRNTVWARVIIDELMRAGVRDLCLAPGSRSTPLVLAAAERAEGVDPLRLRVFVDERSAAFFALGIGKASGRVAAVLTTSGTAVANLLPAVVEAAQAESPLLLVTADRPAHLRDADANQVIVQRGIFGVYPRLEFELPAPTVSDPALRHLRALVARAVAGTRGLPAGPVHLNVPLAKPLEPTSVPGDLPDRYPESAEPGLSGRPGGVPWVEIGVRRPRAGDDELEELASAMGGAAAGVIVAGPHPDALRLGPRLRRLAATWGVPLLADVLSGGRHGPTFGAVIPGAYDLVLRDEALAQELRPDFVLRIGAAPTSAALLAWLDRHGDAPQVVIDAGHRWKDHQSRATRVITACPLDAVERLDSRVARSAAGWRERWERLDGAARAAALDGDDGAAVHEGHLAASVVDALPPDTPLFVSNSMPIRDVDAYGGARDDELPVFGNRGASGIDGIVSTALGVAAGTGRMTVALVGDLAFLHDINGLLASREADARVVFVVVNNDGGGIFHMLPVRDLEPLFTDYFATPHGADLSQGAALYGVAHRRVAVSELPEAVRAALETGTTVVLEVSSDRHANHAGHEASTARALRAAKAAHAAHPDPSNISSRS